uniref:Uncharacterized protein n=1 Tax=Rhizophora mucronata TaxID=61149 RepID=A0A2P2NMY8_RHIMU
MNCPYCLSKLSPMIGTAALHSSFEAAENFEIEYQVADVNAAQLNEKFSSARK